MGRGVSGRSGGALRSSSESLVVGPEAQLDLVSRGFTVRPFLPEAAVERLREAHARLHPHGGSGFDTDFVYLSPGHKGRVDRLIRSIVEPHLGSLFHPSRMFNVTFVVKWPGGGSALPLHQDWSYVDERSSRSFTVWVPLDDTSQALDNGPLAFIPRSHLLPTAPRGANSVPWHLPLQPELVPHLQPIDTPAGSAVVFDCRILHGSASNNSDKPRRAIAFMVASHADPLVYHHWNADHWQQFEVDEDFFAEHGPMDLRARPPGGLRQPRVIRCSQSWVPRRELAALCGIEVSDRSTDQPVDLPMTGRPLGSSRAPLSGRDSTWRVRVSHRLSHRLSHQLIARRSRDPILDVSVSDIPPLDRSFATLRGLSSFVDLEAWAEGWSLLPAWSGRMRYRNLSAAPAGSPAGDVLALLQSELPVKAAFLMAIGPRTELIPARRFSNAVHVSLVPLAFDQPPGTLVLQAGSRMVPLELGRVAMLDPTWEHSAWNVGASEVPILALVTDRRLPTLLRRLRRPDIGSPVGALTSCGP